MFVAYHFAQPAPDNRQWRSTLKPHYLVTQLVLAVFVAFDALFIVFWGIRFFDSDNHLWPITRLGIISQLTSTVAQLWSLGPLLLLAYVVQAIAIDKSIRRREFFCSVAGPACF